MQGIQLMPVIGHLEWPSPIMAAPRAAGEQCNWAERGFEVELGPGQCCTYTQNIGAGPRVQSWGHTSRAWGKKWEWHPLQRPGPLH